VTSTLRYRSRLVRTSGPAAVGLLYGRGMVCPIRSDRYCTPPYNLHGLMTSITLLRAPDRSRRVHSLGHGWARCEAPAARAQPARRANRAGIVADAIRLPKSSEFCGCLRRNLDITIARSESPLRLASFLESQLSYLLANDVLPIIDRLQSIAIDHKQCRKVGRRVDIHNFKGGHFRSSALVGNARLGVNKAQIVGEVSTRAHARASTCAHAGGSMCGHVSWAGIVPTRACVG